MALGGTYAAGRAWRVIYIDPVGTVMGVEVLASVLVEASAATHRASVSTRTDERLTGEANGVK